MRIASNQWARALARPLHARLAFAVALMGTMTAACDVHTPTAPGTLASITVTPNPTLAINATQQFIAVGRDADGVVVVISPVWTIVAGGGAIDAAGMFTAGTVPGAFTATVQAASGGKTGTATVTVIVGALAAIVVTPDPLSLPINGTQQYTAVGQDAGGNALTITPVWSVVAGGGAISTTGLFTAGTVPGTFAGTVQATAGGLSGVATVTVTVGAVATIVVTPPQVTLSINGTQQYTAVGTDAGGNVVAITPVWSVVAGGGAISATGLFTAGTTTGIFPATVRAAVGSVSGTASVTVVVGGLLTITVLPNPATVFVTDTQRFTAIGRDAGGNLVAIVPTWALISGGGAIDNTGLFTAGAVAGTFVGTVQASSGIASGAATVIVTAVAPVPPLVPLGAAGTHGILGGSTVTCVDLGLISADVSVWPGSAITGFPPCVITGATHAADAFAQTAQGDLTTAYNQLDGMPCNSTLTGDLGGQTLQPGVHCSLSSQGLTGEMFLDGLGDENATFVIKAATTLTTASAQVTLLNGAQAKNIYWLVGSSATVGVGSAMKGNIIAFTSITLVDNSTLLGRALARNGAVTLTVNNVITLP